MSETTAETTADANAPEKIYVCPACGAKYDEPTTCSNGHPPTATVEYDRVTFEAAQAGDAEAQDAIRAAGREQGIGTDAGAVEGETSVGPAVEGTVDPPAAPAAENPAGDPVGTGTPPGGATDVPNPAPEATEVFPAAVEPAPPATEPAAAEPVTDVTEPASAPAALVTVVVSGVTYSGTIEQS